MSLLDFVIVNEGVKPDTVVMVMPGACAFVPPGRELFDVVITSIEGRRVGDDTYTIRITGGIRCNATGFEGFSVTKFD